MITWRAIFGVAWMRSKKNVTLFIWSSMLIFMLLMLISSLIGMKKGYEKRTVVTYNAWIKQTGNPKELTYEEFWALKNEGLLGK